MRRRIVVLSGPVGSGKSTLAKRLSDHWGATHVSTRQLMAAYAETRGEQLPTDRSGLQAYGELLDQSTGGLWVADGAAAVISAGDGGGNPLVVIDSVRVADQIEALRRAFGRDVVHLHLDAPDDVLARRYRERGNSSGIEELADYADVAANPTEAGVRRLGSDADIRVDSTRSRPDDVEIRCAAALGLVPRHGDQLVDIVVGGGYGSEGKGNIAFFLAPEYEVLVRVGGPNAGHKVPFETEFTHRLLPSGTLANESATLLIGPGAVLDENVLLAEIAACNVEAGRLWIDPQAMVIEQADIDDELRLVAKIGSTGKGVGAATARRIRNRDNVVEELTPVRLARDVRAFRPYIRSALEVLTSAYSKGERVLLEGTQGTALSLYHGAYPHVTSRDTTAAGCIAEAGIPPRRVRRVIVVCRTYPIRVKDGAEGTSGPMAQEITWEDLAQRSGISVEELLSKERGSVSGKQRRVCEFDWQLLRRSVELNGATDIALTFADYLDIRNRDARRFDQLAPDTIRFVDEVERVAGVPVSLIGTRFAVRSVIDRRQW